MDQQTEGAPGLKLGQRVKSKVTCGVCDRGERGLVVELYSRGSRGGVGAGVLFERGGFDGFAPDEQLLMLFALNEFCEVARGYKFRSAAILHDDWRARRFTFGHDAAPSDRPAGELMAYGDPFGAQS